ncbi:MAG: hypothetical protein IJR48_02595, partial [Oscillibacter sp.]|nr:hypothetical protein [Oscillibacter sp.]
MSERVLPGPIEDLRGVREAVCIHTRKIYDSCRDKDCIEDLRFYPQCRCADVINRAMSVKGGSAKLLHVYVDVEPVSFHRGFYTVDMRFFYHVTLQAYLSSPIPVTVEGLCVFDKRTILYGSEGNARIFSSQVRIGEPDIQMMQKNNLPIAVVEAVDPIVLDARIVDRCDRRDCELCEIPDFINGCFGDGLSSCDDGRQVYITLGQFSIVRLERDTQLLIPMIDYCMPTQYRLAIKGIMSRRWTAFVSTMFSGKPSRPRFLDWRRSNLVHASALRLRARRAYRRGLSASPRPWHPV